MPRYYKKKYVVSAKKKTVDKKQSKQIAKIEKHIKSSELKYISIEYAQAATAGISFIPLAPVAQGDNFFQRTGNVIKPLQVEFHYNFINSSTTDVYQARLMVVRSNDPAGTMNASELFDLSSVTVVSQASYNPSFTHMAVGDKFVTTGKIYEVLWDSGTLQLGSNSAGRGAINGYGSAKMFNKKIRTSSRKPIRFVGTALNAYGAGQLYLVVDGQNADVLVGGTTMCYYTDE